MLPLWCDQLRIALCPDKLVLVRLCRGWRPRITEKRILPCPEAPSGEAPWRAPLAVLEESLPELARRPADVVAILSNHFAHYALVPWNGELAGEEEETAFARYCFTKVYGGAADAWALRVSDDGARASRVACAVDQRLLDGLEEALQSPKLRLRSVQPYLMVAFNQWRHRFQGATAWFALVEGGKLCLGLVHRDRWHALRVVKIGAAWAAELPLILDRETHLVDLEEVQSEVFLFAPEQADLALPAEGGWSIHRLVLPPQPGFSPEAEAQFAVAVKR